MRPTQNEIKNAKQYDLLTFLKAYSPQELVRESRNSYCLKSHSSLKISNGKWYQFSSGIGGRSAIDYLMKIEGYSFIEAVQIVNAYCGNCIPANDFSDSSSCTDKADKPFIIPQTDTNLDHVRNYLKRRCISNNVIDYCEKKGLIKQESRYKNAMFCSYDFDGNIKYVTMRGTRNGSNYKGIVAGSDKHYSFKFLPENSLDITTLHIFEAAVDLLSYATLLDIAGTNYIEYFMLSLDGVSSDYTYLPQALDILLKKFPIKEKVLELIQYLGISKTTRQPFHKYRLREQLNKNLLQTQLRLLQMPREKQQI